MKHLDRSSDVIIKSLPMVGNFLRMSLVAVIHVTADRSA